jgi:tetratricopeptide (TPR) repeat protein
MFERRSWVFAAALLGWATCATATVKQGDMLEVAKGAFESSDYTKAVQVLQAAAAREPQNGDIQLLLAKSYYELQDHDAAVNSAEKAVAINPKSSVYHEWLGRAYGEKASHAMMFSAMSLARKTHKEFETAVQLDERNFSAAQALVEFYCSAPGIVGGGEEKARAQIEKLAALDAAEGHYAAGNCRRQKKDFDAADTQFALALESNPKSADLIYDVGDYAMKHSQPERLARVVDVGEKVAPADVRGKFYRAVGLILKNEWVGDSERLLREYLKRAPTRSDYPRPALAHEWLGRMFEEQGNKQAARKEFETALGLDPKSKSAREALKRLEKN